jgi:hypothetical protein
MRRIWLVGLIAGCGFSSSAFDPAAAPSGGDGDTDAQCDTSDPALRLCMSFDSEPMLQDLTAASRLRIAETPDLDLTVLTIEMWIAPVSTLRPPRYRLLDNHAQYFMEYADSQRIECGIGLQYFASDAKITDTNWHHVACTFDGSELRVYVDGSVSKCGSPTMPLPTNGIDGTAIGASYAFGNFVLNYVGGLDDVHIYARALSAAEICTAAEQSSCNASCPAVGGGAGSGNGGGNGNGGNGGGR